MQAAAFTFSVFTKDFLTLKAQEQDLKSALYAVHPYPNTESPDYFVVLYPDMDTAEIECEVLDKNMMQMRLINQVPKPVIVLMASLFEKVDAWIDGKGEYPHSFYNFPEQQLEESMPISDSVLAELEERDLQARALIEAAGGTVVSKPQ